MMKLTAKRPLFALLLLALLLSACSGEPELSLTLSADKLSGEAPLEVNFSAAVPGGISGVVYTWDFGTDTPVKAAEGGPSRSYTFRRAGTFLVSAKARKDGQTKAASVEVSVSAPQITPKNGAPSVILEASQKGGEAPLEVSFSAAATDPDGDPLSYRWDFGDGETASGGETRTHTYVDPERASGFAAATVRTYTAAVTVSDGRGGEARAEQQVTVDGSRRTGNLNRPPEDVQLTVSPRSGASPLSAEFSASARDPDGDELVYVWNFGDGVISGQNPARHTYQRAGTYDASVTVGDRKGGKASAQVKVEVTGGDPNTPDVPFYGRWVWALREGSEVAFTGYLDVSQKSSGSDSSLEEFFLRGGKGSWTYCQDGLDACGAPTGAGRIDVLDFGDGETFDIVFISSKTGFENLTAYDEDDRVTSENGAPTFRGEGTWYNDDGSSEDLDFTMVKVDDDPQKALDAAVNATITTRD